MYDEAAFQAVNLIPADVKRSNGVCSKGAEAARELIAANSCGGGLMATAILGRTSNPFSFIAYALIALSLVTVDMGIVGRSLQQPISGAAGGGFSPHGGMYADSLLSPSHPRYRPGSLILAQLAANDSNSAENDRKDQDKLHRAAIALMVYLATDGIRR
jgi:hypothetical protein